MRIKEINKYTSEVYVGDHILFFSYWRPVAARVSGEFVRSDDTLADKKHVDNWLGQNGKYKARRVKKKYLEDFINAISKNRRI